MAREKKTESGWPQTSGGHNQASPCAVEVELSHQSRPFARTVGQGAETGQARTGSVDTPSATPKQVTAPYIPILSIMLLGIMSQGGKLVNEQRRPKQTGRAYLMIAIVCYIEQVGMEWNSERTIELELFLAFHCYSSIHFRTTVSKTVHSKGGRKKIREELSVMASKTNLESNKDERKKTRTQTSLSRKRLIYMYRLIRDAAHQHFSVLNSLIT